MKAKLWVLLSLAFSIVALTVALIFFLAINQAIEAQFISYLSNSENSQIIERLIPALQSHYQENENWSGIKASLPGQSGGNGNGNEGGAQRGGPSYLIVGPDGEVIYDSEGEQQGTKAEANFEQRGISVELEGEAIAWLLMETPGQSNLTEIQAAFLKQVQLSLLGISLFAILAALAIGLLFSRELSRPLAALSSAAFKLTGGDFGGLVETPSGTEEIESLRRSFNKMSQALEKSEMQRRAMTSDIAHELRTPVSLIRTQLQAMMDGVRDISPENMALAYDQSIHLGQLIEDLRTLTQAESRQLKIFKQDLDSKQLLGAMAESFLPLAQDADLRMEIKADGDLPLIQADKKRLQQVFTNLLINALQHTQAGGEIQLMGLEMENEIQFSVTNSGRTLSEADSRNVFARFWRADQSRQRDTGGSGLGLAISQELVNLHGGRIWVDLGENSTSFRFTIPK